MSDAKFVPTRTGKADLEFAGGVHTFALRVGELMELDEKFELGPWAMLKAFVAEEWRVPWVREIVRLGLIGGGMLPHKAQTMTRRYVDDVPEWPRNSNLAMLILSAAVSGLEVESPGKSNEAEDQKETPTSGQTDASPSPLTTMPQAQSGLAPIT